jgi:hypothetical protein
LGIQTDIKHTGTVKCAQREYAVANLTAGNTAGRDRWAVSSKSRSCTCMKLSAEQGVYFVGTTAQHTALLLASSPSLSCSDLAATGAASYGTCYRVLSYFIVITGLSRDRGC